jgi:nicotinate-nucleotide adenylyltransferase
MSERLGLFGGTFDPPHLGHLALAEWARERLRLDRVVFVPAGDPPHKRGRILTRAATRLAMTELAIAGREGFALSRIEIDREGPSYTVDTLRALRDSHPGSRWWLLIGEDSLAELSTWKEPEAIVRLATPAVAIRPGSRVRRTPRAFGRPVAWLDNPPIEVSSSDVRARARRGASIRFLVPDAVERFVVASRLYRGTAAPAPRQARAHGAPVA